MPKGGFSVQCSGGGNPPRAFRGRIEIRPTTDPPADRLEPRRRPVDLWQFAVSCCPTGKGTVPIFAACVMFRILATRPPRKWDCPPQSVLAPVLSERAETSAIPPKEAARRSSVMGSSIAHSFFGPRGIGPLVTCQAPAIPRGMSPPRVWTNVRGNASRENATGCRSRILPLHACSTNSDLHQTNAARCCAYAKRGKMPRLRVSPCRREVRPLRATSGQHEIETLAVFGLGPCGLGDGSRRAREPVLATGHRPLATAGFPQRSENQKPSAVGWLPASVPSVASCSRIVRMLPQGAPR